MEQADKLVSNFPTLACWGVGRVASFDELPVDSGQKS